MGQFSAEISRSPGSTLSGNQHEGGEKTEQPSPKKIRDARQKGQVAKSQEVVTTFTLLSLIGYLWVAWRPLQEQIIDLFDLVSVLPPGQFDKTVFITLHAVSQRVVSILIPILALAIVTALAANYAQIGVVFALENLVPKLERVNPGEGFKRIFSMKQLIEILKSLLKIIFLSVLLYIVLRDSIGPFAYTLECGLACLGSVTAQVLVKLLIYSALAFIIVAVADLFYQRHSYTKSLMMSKDEVKREYKESEGDPHIKGKRKQLAHELVMSDAGGATRKSTAVVVNPTHLAVAFRYKEGETPLPIVVAKGRERHAHFLRTQAEEAGVPVFRNVRLAQALYAEADVNQYVPDELFEAIAEVLAWVKKNEHLLYRGRLRHGVIDMDMGDHRNEPEGGPLGPDAI
ncbi:MAG: type III secretion system export apparatus subunit SctU [Methylocystis sp.]|uniref:type III secretion system export apparatus subunit SctU n=1 Tax=Methylocystis sp. TaxID=1911079 RepID=UPI003DA5140A